MATKQNTPQVIIISNENRVESVKCECRGLSEECTDEYIKRVENRVESVKCECCGLSEECTDEYIKRVQDRFRGQWICGLCAEAVKDEEGRIGSEEALNQHIGFCKKFRSLRPPPNPTENLISAMKQLVLRTLDSPRSSPTR